jgi:hypothetical protein
MDPTPAWQGRYQIRKLCEVANRDAPTGAIRWSVLL